MFSSHFQDMLLAAGEAALVAIAFSLSHRALDTAISTTSTIVWRSNGKTDQHISKSRRINCEDRSYLTVVHGRKSTDRISVCYLTNYVIPDSASLSSWAEKFTAPMTRDPASIQLPLVYRQSLPGRVRIHTSLVTEHLSTLGLLAETLRDATRSSET